jgi:hypothetical protein
MNLRAFSLTAQITAGVCERFPLLAVKDGRNWVQKGRSALSKWLRSWYNKVDSLDPCWGRKGSTGKVESGLQAEVAIALVKQVAKSNWRI